MWLNDYYIHMLILIGIYVILAQAYNLTFGLAHAFNLAHAASFGIGAYVTAILATEANYPVWSCLLSSTLFSGIFAILIGLIALKLHADYFAIGTLAFHALVASLFINWKSVTRGVLGIPGIPRPEIGSIDFYQNSNFLFLVLVLVLLSQLVIWILFRNGFARRLRAQAEYPQAAESIGIPAAKVRNLAFMFSSSGAGLAGSLFAYYIQYIDPSSFLLPEMVFVLTIVILGKPGSFIGTIFATIFLLILPEILRDIELEPGLIGPLRQLIYAVVLFSVVFFSRNKLFPKPRSI